MVNGVFIREGCNSRVRFNDIIDKYGKGVPSLEVQEPNSIPAPPAERGGVRNSCRLQNKYIYTIFCPFTHQIDPEAFRTTLSRHSACNAVEYCPRMLTRVQCPGIDLVHYY